MTYLFLLFIFVCDVISGYSTLRILIVILEHEKNF